MADSQGFSNSAGPFGMAGNQPMNQGAANPMNWTGHQPTFYGNRMHMDMQGPPGFGGYGGGKGDGYGGGKGDGGGKGYERAITWNSKVFDTKIAEQKDRQFNGDHTKGDSLVSRDSRVSVRVLPRLRCHATVGRKVRNARVYDHRPGR